MKLVKQFGRDAWNRLSIEEQQSYGDGTIGFTEAIVKICCPLKKVTETEFEELHDYIITEKTFDKVFGIIWDELNARQTEGHISKDIDLDDLHGYLMNAAYKIIDYIKEGKNEN